MNTKRNVVIPAVFLVLRKDEEILLQRRFNTGFQDGQYTFPSGHVEAGESPITAVCREGKEETGVEVNPEDLIFEQVLYRRGFTDTGEGFDTTKPERVDIFFSTTKWTGEPMIMESDKCDDLSWFPLSRLPLNLFPIVKTFLEDFPNQLQYKESGY